jgi:uncharacterized protein (DUF1501 family)
MDSTVLRNARKVIMSTNKMDRREFLQTLAFGAAALSAAGFGPLRALAQTARGAMSTAPSGKRLLILNLAGGFDPLYVLQPDLGSLADRRPGLFQDPNTLLPFSGQLGLTPSFPLLGELFAKGEALVVHRAGVLNATREHQSSESTNARGTFDRRAPQQRGGWVQRVADANPRSFTRFTDVVDLANGNPTVTGGRYSAASVNPALQTFARGSIPEVRALRDAKVYELESVSVKTPLSLTGAQGSLTAAALSETLAKAVTDEAQARAALGTAIRPYPATRLGETVSAVETVFSQLGTQIAYVRTAGFDTHLSQADRIVQLFGGVNEVLSVLRSNLIARGLWDDTIVLTTTDFGREIRVNSSQGTDHGRGADVFVLGSSVAGGRIIGEDYTDAEFAEPARFLEMRINVQNILRETVAELGYEPDAAFQPFAGEERLGLFA